MTVVSGYTDPFRFCSHLAVQNAKRRPFWHGGPVGDGRHSVFLDGPNMRGQAIANHLLMAGGNKETAKIYKDLTSADGKQTGPIGIEYLPQFARNLQPAFIFFGLDLIETPEIMPQFNKRIQGLKTAFVAVTNKPNPRTAIHRLECPWLYITPQGQVQKRAGYLTGMDDKLIFSGKSMLCLTPQSRRFKSFLDKNLKDKSLGPGMVRELARRQGFTGNFLRGVNWEGYGYIKSGKGYGADYRATLKPINLH